MSVHSNIYILCGLSSFARYVNIFSFMSHLHRRGKVLLLQVEGFFPTRVGQVRPKGEFRFWGTRSTKGG